MLKKQRKGSAPTPPAEPAAPDPMMTAEKAAAATFVLAEPRGYYHVQVDAFVDQVVDALRGWEQAVNDLRQQLYGAQTEIDQLRYDNQGLRAQIEIFRVEGSPIVDHDGNYVTESQLAAASSESAYLASEVSRLREANQMLTEQLAAIQQGSTQPFGQEPEAANDGAPPEFLVTVDEALDEPQWGDTYGWDPHARAAVDVEPVQPWESAEPTIDDLAEELFASYDKQPVEAPQVAGYVPTAPLAPAPAAPRVSPTRSGPALPPPPPTTNRRPLRPVAAPSNSGVTSVPTPETESPPAFAMPERAQAGPVFEVPMDAWEMNTVVLEGDEN